MQDKCKIMNIRRQDSMCGSTLSFGAGFLFKLCCQIWLVRDKLFQSQKNRTPY